MSDWNNKLINLERLESIEVTGSLMYWFVMLVNINDLHSQVVRAIYFDKGQK